jgi:hypothetical protein
VSPEGCAADVSCVIGLLVNEDDPWRARMGYIETPPPSGAWVNVIVGAKGQSVTHTGDLNLGRERLEASTTLEDAAIGDEAYCQR